MLNRPAFRAFVVTLLMSSLSAAARGQSLQQNSFQFSGAVLAISSNYVIPGGEVQYRRTSGTLSVGGGIQLFYDPTKICSGGANNCTKIGSTAVYFVEPRLVVATFANDKAATYVAGRVAYAAAGDRSGAVFGGGGGVLTVLNDRTSLDLGAQVYSQGTTSSVLFQFRAGLAIGF
jgi:hypothetical protein